MYLYNALVNDVPVPSEVTNLKAEMSITDHSRGLVRLPYLGLLLMSVALFEDYLSRFTFALLVSRRLISRHKAVGIVERILVDAATKELMDIHLQLTLKQIQDPEIAHDFKVVKSVPLRFY